VEPLSDIEHSKQEWLSAMEVFFGPDVRRINHARKVTAFAERILRQEGGWAPVVLAAAIFHDVGIPIAEKKHGSSAGRFQELEGPPVARRLLEACDTEEEIIREVCDIIAHHHSPSAMDTLNFRVVTDADWLVNLEEEGYTSNPARLERTIQRVFKTTTGRRIAQELYLSERSGGK